MSKLSDSLKQEYKKPMFMDFVMNAMGCPERIAVTHFVSDKESYNISYGELLVKAVAMAAELKNKTGGIKENIGVILPRGIDQIIALLAVQMSNGAYVPIRISQPVDRIKKIAERADIRRIIAWDSLSVDTLGNDIEIIKYGSLKGTESISISAAKQFITYPFYADTAYIIFTSGSTGEPKGVEIQHGAALNTIMEINKRFAISSDDTAMNVSSYDFDLSVYDIFGMLNAGGTIVTMDEVISKEPEQWKKISDIAGVTLWNSVPAIFDMLCTASRNKLPASLKYVLLSGDWVSRNLYFRLGEERKRLRFAALGGATEASIWSNIYEVSEKDASTSWGFVPYGKALPAQKYMIVSEEGTECPVGVQGELWIGGCGLAKGYIGNPEETFSHFVECRGEQWYRTGDVGFLDENDDIIFCGRLDSQIKLNGFRIETGEIETELCRINGIRNSAVMKLENNGKSFLAATVVLDSENLSGEEIKEILRSKLPAYMIPEVIKRVAVIPLTENGKYDKKKLSLLFSDRRNVVLETPVTDTERKLEELWKKNLGCAAGRKDNFFDLGGDSLKATALISAVEDSFRVTLSLGDIFHSPGLADMAEVIDKAISTGQFFNFLEGEI